MDGNPFAEGLSPGELGSFVYPMDHRRAACWDIEIPPRWEDVDDRLSWLEEVGMQRCWTLMKIAFYSIPYIGIIGRILGGLITGSHVPERMDRLPPDAPLKERICRIDKCNDSWKYDDLLFVIGLIIQIAFGSLSLFVGALFIIATCSGTLVRDWMVQRYIRSL